MSSWSHLEGIERERKSRYCSARGGEGDCSIAEETPAHLFCSPVQPLVFVSAHLQAGEEVTDGRQDQQLLHGRPSMRKQQRIEAENQRRRRRGTGSRRVTVPEPDSSSSAAICPLQLVGVASLRTCWLQGEESGWRGPSGLDPEGGGTPRRKKTRRRRRRIWGWSSVAQEPPSQRGRSSVSARESCSGWSWGEATPPEWPGP